MEVQARSILQKSGLPGASFVINPYIGCVHGCVYCYARFMRRFTGHKQAWGKFLDVKVNAAELLERELSRRRKPLTGWVFMSSVTDPYLPLEARYELTRRILEVLSRHRVSVSILTKSDLVLRDVELLKTFKGCEVGLSLMTVDDELARRLEHNAPAPSRRLHALRGLKQAGINTYAFVSPYMPGLSHLPELVAALRDLVDEIGVEAINMNGVKGSIVQNVLTRHYPQHLSQFERFVYDQQYWDKVESKARTLVCEQGISFMGFFRH